jgi:hypothetical protein
MKSVIASVVEANRASRTERRIREEKKGDRRTREEVFISRTGGITTARMRTLEGKRRKWE